jgi:hypothetical protein
MTAYQLAKLVNEALESAGIDKRIPPQMIYTYVRKGYIKVDEAKRISVEEADRWMTGYLTKQGVTVEVTEEV